MRSKAKNANYEDQGKTTKAAAMRKREGGNSLQMVDNRAVSLSQAEMHMMIEHSQSQTVQREKLERTFDMPMQRQGLEEEEERMYGKFETVQLKQEPAPQSNCTGLPDNLKAGTENLSGISMDHVKVHYNSSQPAQLNALAYARGSDIHVASGQELHLPHETWHVVQQAQGRVKPTMQLNDRVPVNDDQGLEYEADVMGAKALQMRSGDKVTRRIRPLDAPLQRWKSKEQIAARRAAKAKALRGLIECAVTGKAGARMLWKDEPLELSSDLTAFYTTINDAEEIDALNTGKGCNRKPGGVESQYGTLWDFLTHFARGGDCGQAFAHDCVLWARQVARMNPKNANLQSIWLDGNSQINIAKASAIEEAQAYYKHPVPGRPATPDQAKYYLAYYRHEEGMEKDYWDQLLDTLSKEFGAGAFSGWDWKKIGQVKPDAFKP